MKKLFSFLMNFLRKFSLAQNAVVIPNVQGMMNYCRSELIEPHAGLLKKPAEGALLYKIVSSENFLNMLENHYLYFRRVDTYRDDTRDSDLPDKIKEICEEITIGQSNFSWKDNHARSRARTYACCFSTEKTSRLWCNYGGGDVNALCLVFDCHKLIHFLNSRYEIASLVTGNQRLVNFLYINHGLVTYGNFTEVFLKESAPIPNPIEYAYFKDALRYSEEKEFRVSLSHVGVYAGYVLPDGSEFNFADSMQLGFDFVKAVELGVLKKIDLSEKCEAFFKARLRAKLEKTFSSEQVSELLNSLDY